MQPVLEPRLVARNNLALRHPCCDNDLQEFVVNRCEHHKDDLEATPPPCCREKAYAPKIFHKIPIDDWFRGPLLGFLREQLVRYLARQGLFDRGR
jgi:hypothetical protein